REYRKHSKRRRGTFYGWGAHGNGNIEKLCNLFQQLGYEHVVGIYDDAHGETELGMNGKFEGKFFFHELPTPDVRDKPNKGITGIFDGNGELRGEYQPYLQALFDDIDNYIDGQGRGHNARV